MYKERYSESYYHAIAEKDKIFKITLVISAFLSMIFLDQTAVGVTLASIQKELVLSASTIAWIMNAYMITLSAFLLLFARLSDSIGIKNLFCAGILIFLLASLGCAVSNSGAGLIINRGLQGIGASMEYATYLLIFNNQVPANKRGKVLGKSAAFAAVFLALGPLIGGFFSNVISWRYLFWLNVPICLVCFYFAISACNKDSHPVNHAFLDKLGLLIYLFAMTGLIFFLMEGPTLGWTNPAILISLISSLLFFTLFVYHEKRQRQPLIEMALFKNKEFFASVLILFGNYACITTMAFWALWIEQVLGYSPLMTGVALLPAGVPFGIIIDGSHTGFKTSMDALNLTTKPFVFSHSGVYCLAPHVRNVRDEQIKSVAATGGVIGVNGLGILLGDVNASIGKYVDHIDYITKLVGAQHVAIGLDNLYFANQFSEFMSQQGITHPQAYASKVNNATLWRCLQPENVIEVVEMLLQRGYSENEIKGILGGNILRIMGYFSSCSN